MTQDCYTIPHMTTHDEIKILEGNGELPKATTICELNGKKIYLIATAHVSLKSVEDVKKTIELIRPDTICVELCPPRHEALTDKERWKKMDIFKVIKNGKAVFLLAQLIIASFYQKIGDKLGVQPGAEMIEGVKLAEETHAKLVLADRPIEITLKRVWRHLGFFSKIEMITHIMMGIFDTSEINEELIENIKESNELESVMEVFSKTFPQVKEKLIDERDVYLAQKIRNAPGEKIVAILGAGHVAGVIREMAKETPIEPLEYIPPPSSIGRIINWSIPFIVITFPVIAFLRGDSAVAGHSIMMWIVTHSFFAGLGCALALGHPLAILTAIIASPFAIVNPVLIAGFSSGFVQAWVKRPTVGDLERVPQEIKTLSGFWRNPTTRILLVTTFTKMGSGIATIVFLTWMVSLGF